MAKEIEIEKKYKVKALPENLDSFEHMTIEQSYLTKEGTPIRIRKFIRENEVKCIFSKKAIVNEEKFECIEYNIELPENLYEEFVEAREGRMISKTRYKIPLDDGLKVDLDVFHGFFEGVCIAEIEFKNVEQFENYKVPDWLGEEIVERKKSTNQYMASKAKDISEYEEFMVNKK